ncbi:hypothetical protein SPIROBIBN47_50071 [uncultured spirochete]|uniref:Uncharacterized protein n=1 Tax=uncultured spirochete TaxID=156406 RepID=A0A3P3XMC0_9SPIR|nr:hypothetical protein SPIROBIBN47_50071 [uncultured spirochete]
MAMGVGVGRAVALDVGVKRAVTLLLG